ncbi:MULTISPECIES: Bug family tripartite tricarboxylate transporter substrate binding protein [Polaromonas]|uniref:Bug family tripartite tricarboxylate transporter substrate binding protein n=1 Tax=Polaromonas aquatica TaxID=332657 RepID=A0ABW1U536_9BURK
MNFRRKSILAFAAVTAMSALAMPAAHAQAGAATDWPARPVMLINPFAAGSAVDVVARVVAQKMTMNLGQPINIDYRTGASGNIGTDLAARARPDGYTLLLGSPGTMAINPFLFSKLPYDAVKDFVAVGQIVSFPQVVVANPKQSIKSIPDLIAAARANPGAVMHGSSGQGTTSHLVMELIKADAKVKMTHVSYRGGAPTIQAVAAGEVQTGVEGLPSLMGQIKAGTVLPLAVTSAARSPLLPMVPAVSEFLPGFDASAWILLMAPAGTPPAVVAKISAELRRAVEDPAVRAQLESQGASVVGSTPQEAAAFHQGELRKFKRAVEISGAKAEQ